MVYPLTSCVKINIVFIHADHVTSRGKRRFIPVRGVNIHHLQRNLQGGNRPCLTSDVFFLLSLRAEPIRFNSLQML